MPDRYYITTTIPYVNSDPHIGFALEIIEADVVARYKRLLGKEVFFSTGTDEFGQKIWQAAQKENKSPKDYVDFYAKRFEDLKPALNLSYDNFIRTTTNEHQKAAQEFWKLCDKNGDIYKKAYEGLYCVGCEVFLKEQDLVNNCCPLHPNLIPEKIEEENYFFRLSKYADQLKNYLELPGVILPDWRNKEAQEFISRGLEDFSISRPKTRLSWGVPVPGDEEHVMYVWFAAFVNYISTLGWPEDTSNFNKFWQEGETVQAAGKDMVRFQSLMWQAMLMSAGFKTTRKIVYHGFITSDGRKISKSLGNVINPFDVVEEYGTDALRYFLLREISPFEDGDFTMEKFKEAYNANLANGVGNLVSRVMKMAIDYQVTGDRLQGIDDTKLPKEITDALDKYDFKSAMDVIWQKIAVLDKQIQETEPFKLIKTEPQRAKEILRELVRGVYEVGVWLTPFLPETSKKICEAVETHTRPSILFPRKE